MSPLMSTSVSVLTCDCLLYHGSEVASSHHLSTLLDDLWPQYERGQAKEEPDWVASEREQFTNYRDKDKDGKLNKREIGDWVLPEDFDHAKAEAKHLIYEADINKVGVIWLRGVVEEWSMACEWLAFGS